MDKLNDPKIVYTLSDIINDIKKNYSIYVTYMQVWRAREKVIELTRGKSDVSSYKLLIYLYIQDRK